MNIGSESTPHSNQEKRTPWAEVRRIPSSKRKRKQRGRKSVLFIHDSSTVENALVIIGVLPTKKSVTHSLHILPNCLCLDLPKHIMHSKTRY
eukprot:1157885-Pelagomonas_calceolata.AAC.1